MCNSITSFLSGFVIFTVLGYMSHVSGRQIQHVATEGPGLVFIVYPAAIAAMPGSVFWALIFFMMLLNLGLDSSVRRTVMKNQKKLTTQLVLPYDFLRNSISKSVFVDRSMTLSTNYFVSQQFQNMCPDKYAVYIIC